METQALANYQIQEESPAAFAAKVINHTNKHLFLTGKAGTGKTTFLKYIINHTHKKSIIVAPTGIAAINAGGVTIHSQFQLPFGAFVPDSNFRMTEYLNAQFNNPETLKRHLQLSNQKRLILRELELLIIDEVSMLRADLLDAIDAVLKYVRRNSMPFGGVQLLFIGDLLQLPPVVKDDEWQLLQNYYKSAFFFDAQVLYRNKPLYIELDKIYRQSDQEFISLLNNLRNNEVKEEDIKLLNQFYKPGFSSAKEDYYITLTTHNYKADNKNKAALNKLPGKPFLFEAEVTGDFKEYAYPVEKTLELKLGAQIMFIKNDPTGQQRFFNGKIATVTDIKNDEIIVKPDGDDELALEKYLWKNIKYQLNQEKNEIEEKEVGTFTQYPIKLAWAITIHKSQGLTFEKAILDINDAFAPGQVYVALSRLKSLNGLVLTAPADSLNVMQEETVLSFEKIKDEQGDLKEVISAEAIEYTRSYLIRCFNFNSLATTLTDHIATYNKQENQSEKQKHLPWALEIKKELDAVSENAEKFQRQIDTILKSNDENKFLTLNTRIEAAVNYFSPLLKGFSKKVIEQRQKIKGDKKTKTYSNELLDVEGAFFRQLQAINKALVLIKCTINNSEFNKETINKALPKETDPERSKEFVYQQQSRYSGERRTKKPKEEKGTTKKVSLDLYRKGKSISEIAAERMLAAGTIEGHLAHFVSSGELDVYSFVEEAKLDRIMDVLSEQETIQMATVREKLGEDFSWTDIRFAISFKKFLEGAGETNSGKDT